MDSGQQLAQHHSGRTDVLAHGPFREAWLVVGRRSGKSRILAVIACFLACFASWRPRLSPGETGVIMLLATDTSQASVLLSYCRALISENPMLRQLVTSENSERIELGSRKVAIEVHVSSYRSVRGRTLIAALCDEVAFWRSDTSANPAGEVVRALRPALASLAPNSLLLGVSSPYSRTGLLWDRYSRHYGREGSRVLIWQAKSREMNETLSADLVADALEDDPEGACAEYLGEFRRDIARFVDPDVIDRAVVPGRFELPRAVSINITYRAFLDPSGGSSDSFTLAIAHREDERAVLDVVREVRPPFSPEAVVSEFAATMLNYGCTRAVADRYAGAWVSEAFLRAGVTVEQCAKPKSDLYGELLPGLNSGRVDLLDHQRLLAQLAGLERRVARGGRDSIDHGPGAHDDLANAAAGALTACLGRPRMKLDLDQIIIVDQYSEEPPCQPWIH